MDFIKFSLSRELAFLEQQSGGLIMKSDTTFIKRGRTGARLKPRTLALGARFPFVLVSNGGVVAVDSSSFGRPDLKRATVVLFEDLYTERGRWGWF